MSTLSYSGTTIGIKVKDGVVLASDKNYIYGNYIFSGNVKKVFIINNWVGASAAGVAGDLQQLFNDISFLIRLQEIRLGRRMNVRSVAKLASVMMYNRKLLPYLTQIIIGGYINKPEIYSLDSWGSIIDDKYIVLGTGAETAIGIIESNYDYNMELNDAVKLVIDGFKASSSRDVLTGNSVDILRIDRNGIKEETLEIR